ncbi:Protein QmcA (possibly involved in integral membrane quality control) [hydrothermal vent metagenome]|uniref:Protein QmcA (Possibly involved in integral membrane quality control) n=1 Tax=hydrothermal vent metagenome TaxID=652676 RepID=A0A3B1BIB2_9ZZZZ
MPDFGFSVFALILVGLAGVLIFSGVKVVTQGHRFTVERFGKFTRTLNPGLHIIVPIIDRIGNKVNVMEQVLDIKRQVIITKDNATATVDGVLYYQIMDAAKSSYEVNNLTYAIHNLGTTNLRTVMGSMDLDELLSKRDDINARLLSVIDEATNPWGVKVTRVEIKDIKPPADIEHAMARQMKAEREKRAVVLEAEGIKKAEIERAMGEKQAAILEAEGRLEAAKRDAEARERLAEAEANATRMVSEAIAAGDLNAINYFVAQRYIESLEKIGVAENSKLVFMPLEASGVIGAIGGVADLLKNANKDSK